MAAPTAACAAVQRSHPIVRFSVVDVLMFTGALSGEFVEYGLRFVAGG
jgi:hypothetical protein